MSDCSKYLEKINYHFTVPDSPPFTWIFYGDSITHCAVHTHGWRSFPEIFAARVRGELRLAADVIINTAYSGRTAEALSRQDIFNACVAKFAPSAVFLLVGTNDIVKTEGGPESYRACLESIVEQIVKIGAIPIVQNYPPVAKSENPEYVKRYNEIPAYNTIIAETAAKYGAIFVDHWSHWRKYAATPEILDSWLGETIHPGARGHFEMAMTIFRTLGIYSAESSCCQVFKRQYF